MEPWAKPPKRPNSESALEVSLPFQVGLWKRSAMDSRQAAKNESLSHSHRRWKGTYTAYNYQNIIYVLYTCTRKPTNKTLQNCILETGHGWQFGTACPTTKLSRKFNELQLFPQTLVCVRTSSSSKHSWSISIFALHQIIMTYHDIPSAPLHSFSIRTCDGSVFPSRKQKSDPSPASARSGAAASKATVCSSIFGKNCEAKSARTVTNLLNYTKCSCKTLR